MQTKSNDSDNRIIIFMVFWGGVLIYLLAVLPFLISHKGLFFYYGDYNVQQVPFLIFAHRAVRQGRFFWNPLVDLGGNMTGTFAFYLWGSPFFWLTIPFPENWLVHIMPAIMALKYGTASAASYAWLRTQTRTARAAVLGSMLYAFSGFQACNIVFQHFHDVTAFFPLYLLAFDRFVQGRRESDRAGFGHAVYASRIARNRGAKRGAPKGLLGFILMTALMSVINYYFFFGQVVFIDQGQHIYVFCRVRMVDHQIKGIIVLGVDRIKIFTRRALDLVSQVTVPGCRKSLFCRCAVRGLVSVRTVVTVAFTAIACTAGITRSRRITLSRSIIFFRCYVSVLSVPSGILLCKCRFRTAHHQEACCGCCQHSHQYLSSGPCSTLRHLFFLPFRHDFRASLISSVFTSTQHTH